MIRAISIVTLIMRGIIFGTALMPASPTLAQGCAEWDLSGRLALEQNNGYTTVLTVQQQGSVIKGTADYYALTGGSAFTGQDPITAKGSFDGTIKGDSLEVTVYWSSDSIGVYEGKISSRGRVEGTTHDRMHPTSMALFFSDETLTNCAVAASGTSSPRINTAAGRAAEARLKADCLARGQSWQDNESKCMPVRILGKRPIEPPAAAVASRAAEAKLKADCLASGQSWRDSERKCVPVRILGKRPIETPAAAAELGQLAAASGNAPRCKPGFVWRNAKEGDAVCVTLEESRVAKLQNANAAKYVQPAGGNSCRAGYVWRNAWNGDGVCVTPQERAQAARQNQMSAERSNSTPPQLPSQPCRPGTVRDSTGFCGPG